MQLIGQPFGEAELLAMAHTYERAHAWGQRRPTL
jgi:aspartyl-tRNA(Asn)/glutamyl-tRNA(Gln) amidotransferase subunit A